MTPKFEYNKTNATVGCKICKEVYILSYQDLDTQYKRDLTDKEIRTFCAKHQHVDDDDTLKDHAPVA